MKLNDYLDQEPLEPRENFNNIVAELRSLSDGWERFCLNLQAEAQPDENSWRAFIAFLRGTVLLPSNDRAFQVTLHIRKNQQHYRLIGNRCPDCEDECLTRFVSLDAFVDLIVEQDLDGMLPWQVIPYLRLKVFEREIGLLPLWFLKLQLGLHLLWGAVGLEMPSDLTSARMAACRCGLPREIEVGPIVCLRYRLPRGVWAHAPTIFDAYGGWPWPCCFKVGTWSGTHVVGKTEPRRDCAEQSGVCEIVSAPIALTSLCEPIRLTE